MTEKPSPQSIYYNFPKGVERRSTFDPLRQNIPHDLSTQHLRPPTPRIPDVYDIFIGIASYRDGHKCGFTLWTAFTRAVKPESVFIGIIDQVVDGDLVCLEEYCRRARETWPEHECRYKENIRIDTHDAKLSKGPTVARWQQQQLIKDEEFCMEIDAHSQFLPNWDVEIVKEWARTENEMAVLSTYPMAYSFIGKNNTIPKHYSSHLCGYLPRATASDIPIIEGMRLIDNSEYPQMAALWGGCLSFSKCHAEKRVAIDKHMNWVFWGEEYLRSFQLWTHGYDIYSPSRHGSVVFHNWTNDPEKHRFWDKPAFPKEVHDSEELKAYNRLRMLLKLPFEGPVDSEEMEIFNSKTVRTADQFLKFSQISNVDAELDGNTCHQLYWVPYSVPEIVEELLPGYKMHPSKFDHKSTNAGLSFELSKLHDQNEWLSYMEMLPLLLVVLSVAISLVILKKGLRTKQQAPNYAMGKIRN
ncbi:hypothetical protein THRCLA_03569 [Thraustotheca clavata]|uniref:GlcNac transferase n=1 Tax=Thraustotheca clavata TaxID=74557 RepID=A0A1W0A2C2_9STRA|nr:hypothetical protein THRCLA_03569 [Thraustotheca clavata]